MANKRDDFALADFTACGETIPLKRGRARAIVEEVEAAVARWPSFADDAGVGSEWRRTIDPSLRIGAAALK